MMGQINQLKSVILRHGRNSKSSKGKWIDCY